MNEKEKMAFENSDKSHVGVEDLEGVDDLPDVMTVHHPSLSFSLVADTDGAEVSDNIIAICPLQTKENTAGETSVMNHHKQPNKKVKKSSTEQSTMVSACCIECSSVDLSKKYKCPKCRSPYCSLVCCQAHKLKGACTVNECSTKRNSSTSTSSLKTLRNKSNQSKRNREDDVVDTCDEVDETQFLFKK